MRWTRPVFKRRQRASDGNETIENELRDGPLCKLQKAGWFVTIAYADIPDATLSNSSSFASMAQQLFMSLGVAELILHMRLTIRGSTVLIRSDFSTALVIVGGISLLS